MIVYLNQTYFAFMLLHSYLSITNYIIFHAKHSGILCVEAAGSQNTIYKIIDLKLPAIPETDIWKHGNDRGAVTSLMDQLKTANTTNNNVHSKLIMEILGMVLQLT